MTPGEPLAALGARIRSLRTKRGIKLHELAERTDLSTGFLSRLERGKICSSVANLIQIANALGLAVAELFQDASIVSRSEASVHKVQDLLADESVGNTGYRWRLLAGGMPDDDLEIFYLVFPHKEKMGMLVSHQGQEYCYVLSGQVRFIVGAKSFELGAGEGIHTSSEIPHRAENIGCGEAKVLMVVLKSRSNAEHFDWWKTPCAVDAARSLTANSDSKIGNRPRTRMT